ncbi:MAG TPA: hypothetical protein VGP55_08375 [Chitinophagaceae bacterium]|nr:hypothetical protein [Chitinophagaceae bacterium]
MKIACFSMLFLFPLVLAAQKRVDLDRYHFTVQYRSLPMIQIDSSYRTYNVQVEGTKMMKVFLQDMSPEKSVLVEGWRKLEDDGHLTIKIKLEDLLPESFSVKERVENITNNLGKVTGTRILYSQELVYTFGATADITDYKGIHIIDEVLADRNYKQVYKSPEFSIKTVAEGYFTLNALNITRDLYISCVTRAIHYLSERLTDNFGSKEVTVSDYVWVIGSKKHPEYTANREAVRQLNEVLFSMNADNSIDGARKQLEPVIRYFERIKATYTSSSRHDRKIRYASYYNLAVLYYYLDDPRQMMNEANGLVLNDFDTQDGKAFEQSATSLKNLFKISNTNTRHFIINTSLFKGPYEKNSVMTK